MRTLALALLLVSSAAACGSLSGAGSGVGPALASASTAPGASATISASAVANATAIVTGTIFPIGTVPPGGTVPPPVATLTPSPTPSPAPGGLTQAQLKYKIVDRFGALSYCDPDFYPVARRDEQTAADERFPEIQRDGPTFSAILSYLSIAPSATYTSAQRLEIYQQWKMLNALRLEPQGAGFHLNAIFGAIGGKQGSRVDATIDAFGQIAVASQTPSGPPPCPICLARGTRIATPSGDAAVEELRIGDLVWTIDERGVRVAAPLVLLGSTPVPATHQVVRLALDDGRTVFVSPGHPTADGRRVGDLNVGGVVDGGRVVSADRVAYTGGVTFDVLPAGATGAYWANGVLLASTLR
ncbi:MAG TPA: Hint domain-containing protein [Methylomirabilota bacterium]|nr:Hint domain-containing protein [Methylomirabilota bacterium]